MTWIDLVGYMLSVFFFLCIFGTFLFLFKSHQEHMGKPIEHFCPRGLTLGLSRLANVRAHV